MPPARTPYEPYDLWFWLAVSCSMLKSRCSGRVYMPHFQCVCERDAAVLARLTVLATLNSNGGTKLVRLVNSTFI